MSNRMTDVQNFYANKTIFITGVTGYLGQILLSKLLCSCPNIHCIYILMREKSGKHLQQRFIDTLNNPIFDQAKKLNEDFETRLIPIRGDCHEKDLGLSDIDREMIENEVEIIFHAAATVNFNAPLREAAFTNVRSLDVLLDIAKNMKNLKAFAFVSTVALLSSSTQLIEEKFNEPPMKAFDFLSFVEHVDNELLMELTPKLIKNYPNTYIFTKLIAEDLCRVKGYGLPLCIFRPDAMTPCFKEPLPGWINNIYGAIGSTLAYALGILKVALTNQSSIAHMCPGDYTVNALVVSAYQASKLWENRTARELKHEIPIYNYSNLTSSTLGISWREFSNKMINLVEKFPFYNMFNLPGVIVTRHVLVYRCLIIILHIFPAMIIDAGLSIMGKRPRLKKMYEKMHRFMESVSFFALKNWHITDYNVQELWTGLSQEDKEIFDFNMDDINIDQYIEVYLKGVRLYLANEKEDTIQKAKIKRKKFRFLYRAVIVVVISIILYFLMGSYIKTIFINKVYSVL